MPGSTYGGGLGVPCRAALAGLVVFGVLAGLGLGEIALRLLGAGPGPNVVYKENYRLSRDPTLQYELVPGSRDGAFRISSAGLRDREYPVDKPRGVFRILLIGDSISYGFGVAQGDALSEQLERLLQEPEGDGAGPRFEVLNLGVTGYNIDQIVENLRVRGLPFHPDLIVYAYCLNDPQEYSFELAALKAQQASAPGGATGLDRLAAKSRLVLLLTSRWRARHPQAHPAAVPADPQWQVLKDGSYADYFAKLYAEGPGLQRLRRGVAALRQISVDSRVPLVTLVFPIFMDPDHYRLRNEHRAVARLFAAAGIPTYDLLPLYLTMYETHGFVFAANALHPNAVGHRLAALYLLQTLAEDGVIPRSNAGPLPALRSPRDRMLADIAAQARRHAAATGPG